MFYEVGEPNICIMYVLYTMYVVYEAESAEGANKIIHSRCLGEAFINKNHFIIDIRQ